VLLAIQNARRAKPRKRSVTVADVPMDCGSAPEKLVLHAKPEVHIVNLEPPSKKNVTHAFATRMEKDVPVQRRSRYNATKKYK
jgi:hypothetical protein